MDYRKDTEAVEPRAAKKDDDEDADELAALMGGLGLTKRCQFCQTEYGIQCICYIEHTDVYL